MTLIGRDRQLDVVRELLERARDGQGAGVAVLGPLGSGVSSLLDAAEHEAVDSGLGVLRGAGRRSESHISMALLRELAARDQTGSLARALTAAPADDAPTALQMWAEAAGDLAVIVDDAHLADEPSMVALGYLARRCTHVPVAVIVGGHEPIAELDTIELPALRISELTDVVCGALECERVVAKRIAEVADGSPLVALELAQSLTAAQRRGVAALPEFPLTHAPIRHVFDERIRSFEPPTRRALCVAAAEPTGELRVIAAALRTLGDDVDALEIAEEDGIISITNGVLVFDHSIRRNVAYHQLAAPSRRAAHRALAVALDAPHQAERRAAHLAVGVIDPDEEVAADLEAVAVAAERRHDFAEAARWWKRAGELSPAGPSASRRSARAADAARPRTDPIAGLTRAERRVAEVVGSGATNKESAATLYVSVKTVDAHLQSIYRKLGIRSRAELAVLITRLDTEGET